MEYAASLRLSGALEATLVACTHVVGRLRPGLQGSLQRKPGWFLVIHLVTPPLPRDMANMHPEMREAEAVAGRLFCCCARRVRLLGDRQEPAGMYRDARPARSLS